MRFDFFEGGQDAPGDLIAAGDAAEHVEEDRFDVYVGQNDAKCRGYFFGSGTAADIQEIGRFAAEQLDNVHGRHRQSGAVDHAADLAFELDIR